MERNKVVAFQGLVLSIVMFINIFLFKSILLKFMCVALCILFIYSTLVELSIISKESEEKVVKAFSDFFEGIGQILSGILVLILAGVAIYFGIGFILGLSPLAILLLIFLLS